MTYSLEEGKFYFFLENREPECIGYIQRNDLGRWVATGLSRGIWVQYTVSCQHYDEAYERFINWINREVSPGVSYNPFSDVSESFHRLLYEKTRVWDYKHAETTAIHNDYWFGVR